MIRKQLIPQQGPIRQRHLTNKAQQIQLRLRCSLRDKAKEEEKENDLRLSDLRMEREDLINIAQTNEVILEGIPKKITDLQSLHKRFAQLEAPDRPCVIINRIDAQPITEKDFKSRLSNDSNHDLLLEAPPSCLLCLIPLRNI